MSRSRFTAAYDLHNMTPAPRAVANVQVIYKAENGILLCYGTAAVSVLNAHTLDTYAPGCIYILVSGASSKLYVNEAAAGAVSAFALLYACDVQSSMTGVLTDLTGDGIAPGSADYAIQDMTNSSPFAFANQNEGETVLKVVQANKVHIAEIRAILVAMGIIAS